MVELETKVSISGVIYIPKEIREAFGRKMKIVPNAKAALFFPADASYEDVLSSLKIITADIEHRLALADRRRKAEAASE